MGKLLIFISDDLCTTRLFYWTLKERIWIIYLNVDGNVNTYTELHDG